MPNEYGIYGRRVVWRKVVSSDRDVRTIEFESEPDVFYIHRRASPGGDRLGGPFQKDDNRFAICEEVDCVLGW